MNLEKSVLQTKIEQLDVLIEKAEKSTNLLKEFKETLIYENCQYFLKYFKLGPYSGEWVLYRNPEKKKITYTDQLKSCRTKLGMEKYITNHKVEWDDIFISPIDEKLWNQV